MGVVVIAILTAALALSASAGAGPKAAHIAFMSMYDGQPDIYAMDTQGYAQVNLTHDGTIGERVDSEPAWSPDGQWVAFQRTFLKARGECVQLFLVRSSGKELHALMPAIGTTLAADEHPSWSPDGSRIVFSSNRTGHFELYMVAATGTGLTRITYTKSNVDNLEPAWSPDGKSIAFVHRQWSGGPKVPTIPTDSIYTLSLASTAMHQLTSPGLGRSDTQPAWSANSMRIAFQSNRAGNWDIFFVGQFGAKVTQVTKSLYAEVHPTWSPFGDQIAFISDKTGATELFTLVLPKAGSITPPQQPRQLTFDKAPKANPSWERVFMSASN
jgi:Tol biopolymer transport system component